MISLRKRFMLIVAVFFTAYLALAVYTDNAAQQTVQSSHKLSKDIRELGIAVNALSDSLHLLGVANYQSTLYDDGEQPEAINIRLTQLAHQISKLISLPVVRQNPEFYEPALKLSDAMSTLTIHAQALIELQSDFERKYPAMPIMLNRLQPLNQEISGLIISAIDEGINETKKNPQHEEVLALYRDVRYVWSQLVSSVRVFVANRLGAFGPPKKTMNIIQKDRLLYSEVLQNLFKQLDLLNKEQKLGFVENDALQRIQILHEQYEIYFKQAADIYLSESWRADKLILKEKVDPVIDVAWSQVYLIQNRINAHSQQGMSEFAITSDTLSNYIWVAAILSSLLIFSGYFVFEYLIRKPIVQVANALEAEGKGESYIPQLGSNVKETRMLVNAFSHMQSQVHSRQLRLQSILDNTGEGIMTISVDGRIETVNHAAETLFGYEKEEMIGLDVSNVVPAYVGIANQQHLSKLVNTYDANPTHGEQEVLGQCKNGKLFPMSLRLGQINIEGEILFTALVSDISDRKAMIDRLTQLAERDSLTGLYNRHFLMDELERIVDRASRGESQAIALLYIDLDNFKFVNDTLGHLAGDNVLQEVTRILEKRARGTDLVTRLGGDEFAILVYDVDENQANLTAEAYRKQLADYIFRYQGKGVDIGCSVGVAMLDEFVTKKEDLLSRADLACHIAKLGGRNNVHVYVSKDQENVEIMSADMGWSRRIKSAIEHDEFVLVSQPIVSILTGETLSNEILVRLNGQGQKLIMPSGFLPSAERFGLSVELDHWIIRHSFKLLSQFPKNEVPGISINLSAKTIGNNFSLDLIKEEATRNNISPKNVIFEVTESGAISNLNQAATFLSTLQNFGFKTALDDFGAGYSSFTYLKDLPVDFVKLDGSFVRNLSKDPVRKAIVVAMNDVAHALGKKTVAEFVEDNKTFNILREIGIDYSQGFYTGKPGAMVTGAPKVVYLHK